MLTDSAREHGPRREQELGDRFGVRVLNPHEALPEGEGNTHGVHVHRYADEVVGVHFGSMRPIRIGLRSDSFISEQTPG